MVGSLAAGPRVRYTRTGEKDVFDSEKESRCASAMRGSYSKSLCDFPFRCFGGRCFRPRVRVAAYGSGESTLRLARGSGEEQSADRSRAARLASGQTSSKPNLDAAP